MHRMLLKELTDEIIVEILKIYERITGGYAYLEEEEGKTYSFQLTVSDVIEGLQRSNDVERRYGSKLGMHSKLNIFRDYNIKEIAIYFDFYPNIDRGRYEIEGKELAKTFETEVDKYLLEKKLAIILK